MDEVARLLTLIALAGGALALLGGVGVWFLDETRRIQRTLAEGLGGTPQPMLVARGRGTGVGFNLASGLVVVTWDKGGWRLTYGVDELIGVELIVDRQVAARAFRGEGRRPLDQLIDPQDLVRLRFVFDDPGHPDFQLDLWRPEDAGRSGRLDADEALGEANRWMTRMESLLRRPVARPAAAAVATRVAARPPGGPLFGADALEDDPEDVIN